jgi:hypothetical protein
MVDAAREKWLAENKSLRWIMAAIFLVTLSLMCVQPIRYQMKLRADKVNALTVTPSVERTWRSGVLKDTAGSVALMDGVTGAVWPVYFPHFLLVTYDVISSPIIDPEPRRQAIWSIYDYRRPLPGTLELLDKYGVDYIVINRERAKDFVGRRLDLERVRNRFISHPDLFKLVHEDKDITIFHYSGARPSNGSRRVAATAAS